MWEVIRRCVRTWGQMWFTVRCAEVRRWTVKEQGGQGPQRQRPRRVTSSVLPLPCTKQAPDPKPAQVRACVPTHTHKHTQQRFTAVKTERIAILCEIPFKVANQGGQCTFRGEDKGQRWW